MSSVAVYQSGHEWVAYDDHSHVARSDNGPGAALRGLYALNPAAEALPVVDTGWRPWRANRLTIPMDAPWNRRD